MPTKDCPVVLPCFALSLLAFALCMTRIDFLCSSGIQSCTIEPSVPGSPSDSKSRHECSKRHLTEKTTYSYALLSQNPPGHKCAQAVQEMFDRPIRKAYNGLVDHHIRHAGAVRQTKYLHLDMANCPQDIRYTSHWNDRGTGNRHTAALSGSTRKALYGVLCAFLQA